MGKSGPRESNALRASVLDAALELGIGNNSVVTAWMFSNAVTEEEEEEVRFYFIYFSLSGPRERTNVRRGRARRPLMFRWGDDADFFF